MISHISILQNGSAQQRSRLIDSKRPRCKARGRMLIFSQTCWPCVSSKEKCSAWPNADMIPPDPRVREFKDSGSSEREKTECPEKTEVSVGRRRSALCEIVSKLLRRQRAHQRLESRIPAQRVAAERWHRMWSQSSSGPLLRALPDRTNNLPKHGDTSEGCHPLWSATGISAVSRGYLECVTRQGTVAGLQSNKLWLL